MIARVDDEARGSGVGERREHGVLREEDRRDVERAGGRAVDDRRRQDR